MIELPSPSPYVQAFRDSTTGWIILNRPERRNALNGGMWDAIPLLARGLDREAEVRVIVLRGAGHEAFAAGADISEFAEARGDAEAAQDYERRNAAAFAAIRNTTKPTIAMIAGFCIGGGLALALACDLRMAAENAQFALPPARLGLAYPIDGLRDLLAAVSPAVAKDMIFTARKIEAKEALALGLIDRLVPLAGLEAQTAALCQEIAAGAPLTLTASKRAIDAIAGRPGAASPAELQELAEACFNSADYAEGRQAFLQKRKPIFTGR